MKSHPDSAVAVIGMACRLPGADNLDQFWDLLRQGRTAWGRVPEDRLNRRLYYHPTQGTLNKTYSDLAALVNYRPVDRDACPISDGAIAVHDLAHVTLCEVAAAACRHAGLNPATLPYANTGVYVGHAAASEVAAEMTYGTYIAETAKYLREAAGFERLADGLGDAVIQELIDSIRSSRPKRGRDGWPIIGASMAAALIARTFALNGPYMSFNAACASSSRALAQAVHALQSGSVDMALVGGASFFHSDTLVLFSQSRSVTTKGSHPFSADADGMVVGEGYVTLVLKRLDRAVADKNRVLAVLPGIGISSDGHGKSLWAPRHEGQIKAIQRAYGPAVAMNQLQYIEAHGTSTALGDITELTALTAVLREQWPAGHKIPIGSSKLNVGHTLESAGLVGVAKTVLALQHEIIPPTIDQRQLSPDVDWDNIPLYVPRQEVPWLPLDNGTPRRAGVDAFGIGGLNVHVVVDGYVAAPAAQAAVGRIPRSSQADGATSRDPDKDAVAIIGMGAVMPGALTLEAFGELLTSGRDPKLDAPPNRWDIDAFYCPGATGPQVTPTTRGGYVTDFVYDWRKHKIPPKQIAQASPLQFMILDAVDQAIHRAQYHDRPFDRERVGVVVGTIFGGDYAAQLVVDLRLPEFQERLADLLARKGAPPDASAALVQSYADVLLKRMPALLDETGSFTASALASRITKSFDLMGGAVAVDAGTASSLAALSCCIEQLRNGDCEMMICVGGQHDMTPILFEDWSLCQRLAVNEARSPLDSRADGSLPAEGCGALLLKRLSAARRDKDPIFGIIRGIGASSEACPGEATRQAIRRALQDAQIRPADVTAVETSLIGRTEVDALHVQGLAEAYTDRAGMPPLRLSTLVGQIGDAGGASGMASLLKAALEVESLQAPGEFGLEHPAPYLTSHSAILTTTAAPTPLTPNPDGRVIAGVHSGGVGEVMYHVLLERGSKMETHSKRTSPTNGQAVQPAAVGGVAAGRIFHFDATERRRRKMREKGQSGHATPVPPVAVAPVATAPPIQPVASAPVPPAPIFPPPAAPRPVAAAPQAAPIAPVQTAPPAPAPITDAAASSSLDPQELEKFLVSFVVEHTGYPPEIVELDADLEADLGIDSIKKAQLFGELGEYFDVQPSADLSLDDFPTLRHVLEFLAKAQGAAPAQPAAAAPAPAASVAAPQPAAAPVTVTVSATAPMAAPTPATVETPTATLADAPSLDPQELEKFLVSFVVEHTGYPPEIVELDADLEADLGIDSIKKAQLFGELGEYFDVQPSENLSLDDFPTLRHVLDFLVQSQKPAGSNGHGQPAVTQTAAYEPATVAEPIAPPPVMPAAAPTAAPQYAAAAAPAVAATALDPQELEKFLVSFVVEHTGYPPEIVELEADLEADLGIDSIKKAQLFGELGEYFDVQPSADLSLDDFPTLRHVLDYLVQNGSK